MVNTAQRLEKLRTEKNVSRVQLASLLGFPKTTIEKFETGRLTPNKEQYEKLARYFGVSSAFLKGESDDPEDIRTWLTAGTMPDETPKPAPAPAKAKLVAQSGGREKEDNAVFNLLLKSDVFKSAVLEVLKSPEGQELIKKAMKRP